MNDEWRIKITDGRPGLGPARGGEVVVSTEKPDPRIGAFWNSRLALNLGGRDEYLAVYLTANEAREIAITLIESVAGIKT